MGWFNHVSDAVFDMLAAAMGLDPDLQSTVDHIIPAYVNTVTVEDEEGNALDSVEYKGITTPQFNRNEDVVFYAVSEEMAPETGYITVKGGTESMTVTKTIPVSVLLTFYGPNADDHAEMVWSRLMVDTGVGSPRQILRSNKIVFRHGMGMMPQRPVSVPELEGTLWRRRCDLRLSLSYLCTETLEVTPVETVPEIKINTTA